MNERQSSSIFSIHMCDQLCSQLGIKTRLNRAPDANVIVIAAAREGDIVQHGFEMCGGAKGYQAVKNFHKKAREAASRAVELLSAPPVVGGTNQRRPSFAD